MRRALCLLLRELSGFGAPEDGDVGVSLLLFVFVAVAVVVVVVVLQLDILSATLARDADVVALDTGWRGRELLSGGDVF